MSVDSGFDTVGVLLEIIVQLGGGVVETRADNSFDQFCELVSLAVASVELA